MPSFDPCRSNGRDRDNGANADFRASRLEFVGNDDDGPFLHHLRFPKARREIAHQNGARVWEKRQCHGWAFRRRSKSREWGFYSALQTAPRLARGRTSQLPRSQIGQSPKQCSQRPCLLPAGWRAGSAGFRPVPLAADRNQPPKTRVSPGRTRNDSSHRLGERSRRPILQPLFPSGVKSPCRSWDHVRPKRRATREPEGHRCGTQR